MSELFVVDLGKMPYASALELQRDVVRMGGGRRRGVALGRVLVWVVAGGGGWWRVVATVARGVPCCRSWSLGDPM